ncbi:hypothetical protein D9M72_543570 [compost metagenome]
MCRSGRDDRHFRALLLVRFVFVIRHRAAGGRVEPHQEESGHGGAHAHHSQPENRVTGSGHNCAGCGAEHKDQLRGDRVQCEGRPTLLTARQHPQGLAHHAEDGQGEQAADEDQRQQPLVRNMRHHRPDDGLGNDRGNQCLA